MAWLTQDEVGLHMMLTSHDSGLEATETVDVKQTDLEKL